MNFRFAGILLMICVFFLGQNLSAQTKKNEKIERKKNELIRLTKEISRASTESDAATLELLMDKNFVLYSAGNKIYDKAALIKLWTKKPANPSISEYSIPADFEVRIFGETAILISTITDTEREGEKETVTKTKAFDVWQKTKKGWRWIASRETLVQ